MRLIELEPLWIKYEIRQEGYWRIKPGCDPIKYTQNDFEKVIGPCTYYINVERNQAMGIDFLCPTCFKNNNGSIGTHHIICWDPSVPLLPELTGPGRWHLRGNSFEDLTLVGLTTSSVLLTGGCKAHFHITNGQIVFC